MTQLWTVSLCSSLHFISFHNIISPSYTSTFCVSMIGHLKSWEFMQKLVHVEKYSCVMTSSWLNWRNRNTVHNSLALTSLCLTLPPLPPTKNLSFHRSLPKKALCFIEARYGNVRTRYPPGRPGGSPQVLFTKVWNWSGSGKCIMPYILYIVSIDSHITSE